MNRGPHPKSRYPVGGKRSRELAQTCGGTGRASARGDLRRYHCERRSAAARDPRDPGRIRRGFRPGGSWLGGELAATRRQHYWLRSV